jgi:hypothetical protein
MYETISVLLTDNNTADFQVVNSLRPDLVTDLEFVPASWESCLKQRSNVSNGKKHVTRQSQ